MLYKTTCAVVLKGDRIEKGKVVDLSLEEATRLGTDVVPVEAETKAEPVPTPEKPLEEMNHAELKEKAKELNLKQSGSIADLRERITLHLEGKEELTDDNN
jgi:hypothetical protein